MRPYYGDDGWRQISISKVAISSQEITTTCIALNLIAFLEHHPSPLRMGQCSPSKWPFFHAMAAKINGGGDPIHH